MTAITRSMPCSDIASALPWDAIDWANRANAEIAALWNNASLTLGTLAGVNDITATCLPIALPAYHDGQEFNLVAPGNTTGPVRINIDALGLVAVNDLDGNALPTGAMILGRTYKIRMISSVFRLLSDAAIVVNSAPFPTNHITWGGLICTNDVGDLNNYIGISKGQARDGLDTQNISLLTNYVKRLNFTWAAGTNAGGALLSANLTGTITITTNANVTGIGTAFTTDFTVGQVITSAGGQSRRITVISSNIAMTVESAWTSGETSVTYKRGGKAPNTKYRVFLLRKDSDGTGDIAFSATDVPNDLPAGYSTYRRIWYILTDGSRNIRPFLHYNNNECLLLTPLTDVSGAGSVGSSILTSLAPPSVIARLLLTATATSPSGGASISSGSTTLSVCPNAQTIGLSLATADALAYSAYDTVFVSTSQTVKTMQNILLSSTETYTYSASVSSSGSWSSRLMGWQDPRI